jgi:hypothetical protein
MNVDVLLDLSGADSESAPIQRIIESLTHRDGLAAITRRAWCVLPSGADTAGVVRVSNWQFVPAEEKLSSSNCALAAATRAGLPLLVIREPVIADSEPIAALVEALGADPMFGFAVARVADESGALFKIKGDLGDPAIHNLPRSVMAALPEYYIVPEMVGSCFVVRSEVVANFGVLDGSFRSTAGAWLQYLCRARRAGFRGVIVNRAVVISIAGNSGAAMFPARDEYWQIYRQYPDLGYARQEFDRLEAHEHEALLARAMSSDTSTRKTLLVDGRGMAPAYDETTTCIIGLLDGLVGAHSDWYITVLVSPESSTFHGLSQRYSEGTICDTLPQARFTAALRLSQPYTFSDLRSLHSRALLNFYVMLDTISWDVIYNGPIPDALNEAWRFVAACSDGILYSSNFTRQHFAVRFPPSPRVRHLVCRQSFHKDEYVDTHLASSSGTGYILIVGDKLDHKLVPNTVELLANAFPFQGIRAIGCSEVDLQNVTVLGDGDLARDEIERLFACAGMIVFPSFYAGFGLPLVKGLNYGKAVIARRSALNEETAAHCRADGHLYLFSDPLELVDVVAGLLDGDDSGDFPLGAAVKDSAMPLRWLDVARSVLGFIDESLQSPADSQWLQRACVFRLLRGGK